jgi:hypothetical protein
MSGRTNLLVMNQRGKPSLQLLFRLFPPSLASSYNLPHNLDVIDPIVEGIDDLDVLGKRDSVPGITETFHIVLETLTMLLPNGIQCLCCRWTLVHALKVPNKYGTQLVPRSDRSFR